MTSELAAFFGPMPAAEYHAHPAISRGCLHSFRTNRRECWKHWFAPSELRQRQVPNEAMRFGTLVHDTMFEPEQLPRRHTLTRISAADCRELWSVADFQRARNCAGCAMMAVEGLLTAEAKRESTIIWLDSETGLSLRCRPDWMMETNDGKILCIDLKTCKEASPTAFRYSVRTYGYDLQASHYSAGIRAATGKPVEWLFLAVESEASRMFSVCGELVGEHRAAIYEIDVEAGEAEYRETLRELETAIRLDQWSEPWENKINELSIWRK